MGAWWILALCLAAAGCDVVPPTLLSGPLSSEADAPVLVNAAVVVLQQQGYTVLTADPDVGLVTTDWRDASSFSGQVFLDRSYRTRVSVVVDATAGRVTVQMTRQVKEGDLPWRSHGLSSRDRARAEAILAMIQARAAEAAMRA